MRVRKSAEAVVAAGMERRAEHGRTRVGERFSMKPMKTEAHRPDGAQAAEPGRYPEGAELRVELRLPTGEERPSGGQGGKAVCCRRPARRGGHVDLEKFFDRVNHDLLMAKLAKKVGDGRVLKLIRRYLEAGMMAEGVISPRTQGTPQGGPLSPLLSNILLTSGTGARRACVLSPRGRLQHLRPQPGGR